jgi:hypothetical protein
MTAVFQQGPAWGDGLAEYAAGTQAQAGATEQGAGP